MNRPDHTARGPIGRRTLLGALSGAGAIAVSGCSSPFGDDTEPSGPVAALSHIAILNRTTESLPVALTVRKDDETVYDETVSIEASDSDAMAGSVVDEPWLGDRAVYELHVESPELDETASRSSDDWVGDDDSAAGEEREGLCYEFVVEIWGGSVFPAEATEPETFRITRSVLDPERHSMVNADCSSNA